ncbi:MAG: carboxypeptidase-like regulatory domain-containing protein [Vicinamibacterales bacterium]
MSLRRTSSLSWRSLIPGHPWRWWSAGVVAIIIAATLTPLAEAIRPARIDGRVTGEGHVPLHGARITLRPVEGRPLLTATTDTAGAFTFRQVAPGSYRIDVAYARLHASSNEPLLFEAGETYTLDLPMASSDDPE